MTAGILLSSMGILFSSNVFTAIFSNEKTRVCNFSSKFSSLLRSTKQASPTIFPLKLFTNEKGIAKLDIGLCRGKKTYDKRESLKEQDVKRDIDRIKKAF